MWELKHVRTIIAALLLSGPMVAQEITFTARVDPPEIAVGQRARLELQLENAQGAITPPDLGGLVLVQGPMDQSSVKVINGRMSSSLKRTYIITGTKPGTYTIGPAVARVGGGAISTEQLTLKVVKGDAPAAGGAIDRMQAQSRDLFVTIGVDRRRVHVGEQIVVTYTLFNRYRSLETNKYELPDLNGFWAEEVDLGKTNWEPGTQNINGLPYRVAILKKQVLLPQRSGTLRIDPMRLTCLVDRDFFSRGREIQLTSNAVDIQVDELPAAAPGGFNGAVGEFDLKVSLDRTDVKANEAIELTVRINGRGNIKLLQAPRIAFPKDLEVYDPKIKDRISVTAAGMSGTREFQYLIIPRRPGTYDLPPLEFAYFDPKSDNYRKADGPPLVVVVGPGDAAKDGAVLQRPMQSDVQVLSQDIRFIRTGDLALTESGHFLFGSPAHWAGVAAPALAFLLLLGWRAKRRRDLADMPGARRRNADRIATKRLKAAAEAMRTGDREAFHGAIAKALEGYCADKFSLRITEVNEENLRNELADNTGGDEAARTFGEITATCAMARFAPVEEKPNKELYDRAAALISNIENLTRS